MREKESGVLFQRRETFGSVGQEQLGPRDNPMLPISNSIRRESENDNPSGSCPEVCHQDVPPYKGH